MSRIPKIQLSSLIKTQTTKEFFQISFLSHYHIRNSVIFNNKDLQFHKGCGRPRRCKYDRDFRLYGIINDVPA